MYTELKEKALRAAVEAGTPSFYVHHRKELAESLLSYFDNSLIRKCKTYLDESKLHPAHGLFHCEKVALEAGAILAIEGSAMGLDASSISELVLCVQIAGLLHDIKRAGNDHTIAGSKEAAAILRDFAIKERYKGYIVSAIRNHEAFKKVLDSDDESAKLISDSLYDADKFSGPEPT
jgi:HD superfamily phosphodiesterase